MNTSLEKKALRFLASEIQDFLNMHREVSPDEVKQSLTDKVKNAVIKNELNNSVVANDFISKKFKDWVLTGKMPDEKYLIPKLESICEFAFGFRNPKDYSLDAFSVALHGWGFLKYKDSIANRKDPSISENPLSNDFLKSFFQNGCFLYVYSEENQRVGERTEFLDLYYPKIDALVLHLTSDNKIELLNLSDGTVHGIGTAKWISERSKSSFRVSFPESPRKLRLRFCLPAAEFLSSETKLIIGLFLITNEDNGKVQAGITVLHRNDQTSTLSPFLYDPQDPNPRHTPPPVVIEYIYERYLSWIKTPGKRIYDTTTLTTWIKEKNEQHYAKRRPIENKFLVTFPITSFKKRADFDNLQNELNRTFFDFSTRKTITERITRIIESRSSPDSEDVVVKKIDSYLRDNRYKIKLFPKSLDVEDIEKGEKINTDLFAEITKSLNIVFIIPSMNHDRKDKKKISKYLRGIIFGEKPESTFQRISSIYTIVGYCLALKRNTFILCKNKEDLPLILQEPIAKMKLQVWQYSSIGEIPFLFYYKMHRDQYA